MKTIHTRFGEVEYDPSNVIHFPDGLIGLDQLKRFLVIPNKKQGPLFWIQSIDDPAFAFVVTDPTNFFLDYVVLPDDKEREKLGIDPQGTCFVLAIVSVLENKDITLNLSGPILYAPETNRAMQVILEDSCYDTRTPLPKVETK
ncbi:flagellar assembly protein FliW [Desulfobulbus alkaliphilus]|uniref:flagellar assembly protein FliW n=1 Tax=Desulfobulbus alkaliphilus TaxID=869814 RepID=UPI0019624CCB|nr:flagellar assembly protein FliW [Desulfobulbus alkaliphilus]MBM9537400.1 flagellar assembly protein FliW [Desulfobulbus alkaliphilus]